MAPLRSAGASPAPPCGCEHAIGAAVRATTSPRRRAPNAPCRLLPRSRRSGVCRLKEPEADCQLPAQLVVGILIRPAAHATVTPYGSKCI
eukprot:347383-Chlamydomonas_euryale.AAC.2